MKDKRHIKSFNEISENLNISDVRSSKKIKENFDYKKILIDIDNKEEGYKYYVGYIKTSKRLTSWTHDGIFKGFKTHEDVLSFIDELKDKGVESINIFSPKEYSKIEKIRKQGQ